MKRNFLPQKLVKMLWRYDPETGYFYWLVRYGHCEIGDRAGFQKYRKHGSGPITMIFGGHHYMAHNLAWIYMTGRNPNNEVDHINRDQTDNRWKNLRAATRSQNQANTRLYKNNKLRIRGVHFVKANGRYRVMISHDGKNKHLGYFNTVDEAATAYSVAARAVHGKFAASDSALRQVT